MYIHVDCKVRTLWRGVGIHVFLPFHDGYADADAPYKTLYMLPGYSADASELAFGLPFRRMCVKYGVAVVIPDGENSFYVDNPASGAMYSRFAGEELVSITRSLFPSLSARRDDTFIGGISMGGYGAIINGLRFRDTFSRIAMFSPALDITDLFHHDLPEFTGEQFRHLFGSETDWRSGPDNPQWALNDALERGGAIPRMFLCCGEQDDLVADACKAFESFARAKGLPIETLYGSGAHEMVYWDGALDACFRFLTEKPIG